MDHVDLLISGGTVVDATGELADGAIAIVEGRITSFVGPWDPVGDRGSLVPFGVPWPTARVST